MKRNVEDKTELPEKGVIVFMGCRKNGKSESPAAENEKPDSESARIVNRTLILLDEDDANFYAVFLCPGASKDRIDICIDGDQLIIDTKPVKKNKDEQTDQPYLWENVGKMTYTGVCELPEEVIAEEATAEYKDGVVYVLIPKSEETQAHNIPIV